MMGIETRRASSLARRSTFSLFALVLAAIAATAGAEEMTLQDCVALESAVERLDCYDAIADRPSATQSTRSRPTYQAREPEPTQRVEPVANVERESSRAPALADGRADEPVADEAKPRRNWFTLRKKPRSKSKERTLMRATIEGVYELSRGNFRLLFDNGEVWQEIEQDVRTTYEVGDEIEIRRGTFTAFLLHSITTGRTTKVKRLDDDP